MQARSAQLAISPPRASSSRTRCPLPVPPMAGLQGILPMASRLTVKHTVRSPIRAAAGRLLSGVSRADDGDIKCAGQIVP